MWYTIINVRFVSQNQTIFSWANECNQTRITITQSAELCWYHMNSKKVVYFCIFFVLILQLNIFMCTQIMYCIWLNISVFSLTIADNGCSSANELLKESLLEQRRISQRICYNTKQVNVKITYVRVKSLNLL